MTGQDGHHEQDAAELWRSVAGTAGEDYADRYADRFEALAAQGDDPHGEAGLVHRLIEPGARVLDAGCGTGRVGLRLHDLGHDVVGVDADEQMIDAARRRSPGPRWLVGDLAELDLGERFDCVVLAGNVVPFLSGDRLRPALGRVAAHLTGAGIVVCGYGLDAQHVPRGGLLVSLQEYDAACAEAGLALATRFAGWDGGDHDGGGYAVSVHRLVDGP